MISVANMASHLLAGLKFSNYLGQFGHNLVPLSDMKDSIHRRTVFTHRPTIDTPVSKAHCPF